MAKPPHHIDTMPKTSRTSTDDPTTSKWTAVTHICKTMPQICPKTMHTEDRQSKPGCNEVAQMTKLGEDMVDFGSRYLQDHLTATASDIAAHGDRQESILKVPENTPSAAAAAAAAADAAELKIPQGTSQDTTAAATAAADVSPIRRNMSGQEQVHFSKRTKFDILHPQFNTHATPTPVAAISQNEIHTVTPNSSYETLDVQAFLPSPDNEVGIEDWIKLSELWGDSQNVSIVTASIATGPASNAANKLIKLHGDMNHTEPGGKYLKKFVANTYPKMTLKEYFEHHDGNLICLCGRGAHNNHQGNKDYRDFVSPWLQNYESLSKEGKEELTNSVVQEFESQGRRFFKLNGNSEWEELARHNIRRKISQRFRDSRTRPEAAKEK